MKRLLLKFINKDHKKVEKEIRKLRNFYDTMPRIKSNRGCLSLFVYNTLKSMVLFFTIGVAFVGTLVFLYYTWVFFYRAIFSHYLTLHGYKVFTTLFCFLFVYLCRKYLKEFEKVYYM